MYCGVFFQCRQFFSFVDCLKSGPGPHGPGSGLDRLVLGKFGLVRFEALFAKPETKPFGFFQIF